MASFLFVATQYEIPFKLTISTFHVSVMARKIGAIGDGVARGDSASLPRSDCGTMRDTVIFAAFLLLLILAVVLIARFIVS